MAVIRWMINVLIIAFSQLMLGHAEGCDLVCPWLLQAKLVYVYIDNGLHITISFMIFHFALNVKPFFFILHLILVNHTICAGCSCDTLI